MNIVSRESLQLAATAWCSENTKNKEMDPALATEFAKILDKEKPSFGVNISFSGVKFSEHRIDANE